MPLPNRRRFLNQCSVLVAGTAGGMVLPSLVAREGRALAAASAAASPEAQLRRLKIELPVVAPPTRYAPTVRVGNVLYVSGFEPKKPDGSPLAGKLGQDLDAAAGAQAARQVALIVLSVIRSELGSLDRVVRLVKTFGMVNCVPNFTDTPTVMNGFNDLIIEIFGERAGKGVRSAVGMNSLPDGSCVEVETVWQVKG